MFLKGKKNVREIDEIPINTVAENVGDILNIS